MTEPKVAQHGVSCLGNMAFNYQEGVDRMVKAGSIKTLELVLQKWPENKTVSEVTLVTMSNIMYRNDPVKGILGSTCGDEVVAVVKILAKETRVCIAAMRAMGNLASLESNVNWMLEHNAAANIVYAMELPENSDQQELVQTAIDVLGNLASVGPDGDDDDDDEEKEEQIQSEMRAVHSKIINQGGGRAIIEAMSGPCASDPSVLMSALETLSALCGVEDLCLEVLVPLGLLDVLMDVMKQFDWDDGIMEKATGLVVVLTYFEECVDSLADLGVMDALIGAMDTHDENHEVVLNCQVTFTNMAINFEEQEYLVKNGGLDAMLRLLVATGNGSGGGQATAEQTELHTEVVTTLTRLACTDDFSTDVAERGMSEILGSYASHQAYPEFITSLFTLVSQLAFHKENLRAIIQYGGIKHAIDAVSQFPEESQLVVQAIQLVDNCATASSESANIVSTMGGKELFDTVVETYQGHEGFEVSIFLRLDFTYILCGTLCEHLF